MLALLGCGLLWSTAGVLIKTVDWPPLAIAGVRSGLIALALALITRPRWQRPSWLELGSALGLAGNMILFVLANRMASPANAILIQYASPAWAALLGTFVLHERVTKVDWLAIGLALTGVTIFFVDQLTLKSLGGNAIALAGGVALAIHVVLLRRIARANKHDHDPTFRVMIMGQALAAVICAPFVVTAPPLAASGWLALVALALVQQTIPALIYAWAITRVTAVEALLVPVVEPITSPIWVYLAFGDSPGRWALLGGAIVVAAVITRALAPRKPAGGTS